MKSRFLSTCLSGLALLFFVGTAAAQLIPGGSAPGFYSSSKLEPRDTSSLEVQVREPNGSTLQTMAIVSVTNLAGQLITSKTTFGSAATFTPLNRGQYTVNVEAAGYAKTQVEAVISADHGQQVVIVTLKSEDGVQYSAPSGIVLAPKAQKEAAKGSEALQANKYDDAIKHLEAAHRLAPNHPDISYLLGVVYEKKNDLNSAQKYWEQALTAQPKHLSSLLAFGELKFRHDDLKDAKTYFERAVEAGPNSWRGHTWLANVLLREGSYADAVTHAERAMDLGKGQAVVSLLILGQALAAEHQNVQAIAALKDYLASKPPEPQVQGVEKLITRLSEAPSSPDSATVGGVTATVGDAVLGTDVPEPPLTLAVLHWLPPNVDDAVPPAEPGIACSPDEVIKNASARVKELPALVDRYTATEVVHHEDMSSSGYAENVVNLSFNYLASIRELKSKFGQSIDVQEYRNGSTGNEMFPNQMASTGLPSIVLIFHPWLISDFDVKCEGLSRSSSGFAWQVYFSQKKEKESRIRQYRIGGHVYPVALKGRAWIDANTFQIVRLDTDLREARPELRLAAEHLVMEYGPVRFKSRKEALWLPSSAEYYAIFRGRRFHRRHTFTDYILFSVENKEKISEPPKEKAVVGVKNENKPSDRDNR